MTTILNNYTRTLMFCFLSISCSKSNIDNLTNNESIEENIWLVDNQYISGGLSEFQIITNPIYKTVNETITQNSLHLNSKVGVLKLNDIVYVYPNQFLTPYEVINDTIGSNHIAITYCPLTLSIIAYDRKTANEEILTLKASGYLYKNNQVFSTLNDNQYWSQMQNKTIRGFNYESELQTINIIETTWETVIDHFPEAKIFALNNATNCISCDTTNSPLNLDNYYGIINNNILQNNVKLYDYNSLSLVENSIYNTALNNKSTLIVGNKKQVFFNSFYVPNNLNFLALSTSNFPNILIDNEGNIWNIFGEAVQVPRTGNRLESPESFSAAEWAWVSLYNNFLSYE
ncbi:DUF3179 domain-containing (seleno)protein [Lacinutrix salivirga]